VYTPVDCSSLNGVCVVGACNLANGQCIPQPANESGTCTDNDACTINDACMGGSCAGTPVNPQTFCDDFNNCTDDDCDSLTGCTHVNNTDPCDDANSCTTDDVCTNGTCTGTPPPPWGDVHPVGAPNGIVNLDDILCVLNAFATPALCPDADLKPCGGDGLYNLDDILGVLAAFSGVNQCPCSP
jgi:hypothetical protein